MLDDPNDNASPFHKGERAVQERLGIRDRIERFARRVVRDHLPEQHRAFYAELPFFLLGSVDDEGRPWASLVAGRPGFLSSPDAKTLDVAALPLYGDPLHQRLTTGTQIGVLGIQPETRRRNRISGSVSEVRSDGFTISVGQAFGNCPQYIQAREIEILPEIDDPARRRAVNRATAMDRRTRALIERSDTLFIATAYTDDPTAPSQGADVSHRGGKPGFVRVEDDRHFVFPDFSGNNHFNTVGNLVVNPKAGFLFIDFDTGDLVYLTGTADIVWEGEELRAFAGAERLIRIRIDEVVRVEESLPLRFTFGDYSPTLEQTGSWEDTAGVVAAEQERNRYLAYEIFDIEAESDVITSFYLRRADRNALAGYEPGQFLPIRLTMPGQDASVVRTYTVSDAPNSEHYRLSIKREGGDALVSRFLHDHVKPGYQIEAMAPRGKFSLDQGSDRPVVLISGGVGITPMIAMINFIIKEGRRTRNYRRTYFIHGARNGAAFAFGAQLRRLASTHESFTSHIRFSAPSEDDEIGVTHDSEGHIDKALLKSLLPLDDYDFYLCGPAPFMQSVFNGLSELGVREERIRYESFGPATVLKGKSKALGPSASDRATGDPIPVHFAASELDSDWTPEVGTLLDLAENAGLSPNYSCRAGICGTCATRMMYGTVDYVEEPSAPVGADEVLICCATPRAGAGDAACGEDQGVVLDL